MYLPHSYNPTYQSNIASTIVKSLQSHSRVMALRVDCRFPDGYTYAGQRTAVITRFFESLKAKVKADLSRKEKQWGRKLVCELKYAWVREFGDINGKKHFHVLVLVNKDVYHSLGDYTQAAGTLSAMAQQAWCSATQLPYPDYQHLTHFPDRGVYYLEANSPDLALQLEKLLNRANYLAKEATKLYGDGERSFGCSR